MYISCLCRSAITESTNPLRPKIICLAWPKLQIVKYMEQHLLLFASQTKT